MWERNIDWVPLIDALTEDRTCGPGMCPDEESNTWPFSLRNNGQPTKPHWPGLVNFSKKLPHVQSLYSHQHIHEFLLGLWVTEWQKEELGGGGMTLRIIHGSGAALPISWTRQDNHGNYTELCAHKCASLDEMDQFLERQLANTRIKIQPEEACIC